MRSDGLTLGTRLPPVANAWKTQGLVPTVKLADTWKTQGLLPTIKPFDMWKAQGVVPTVKLADAWKVQRLVPTVKLADTWKTQGLLPTIKAFDTWKRQALSTPADGWKRPSALTAAHIADVWNVRVDRTRTITNELGSVMDAAGISLPVPEGALTSDETGWLWTPAPGAIEYVATSLGLLLVVCEKATPYDIPYAGDLGLILAVWSWLVALANRQASAG